jgi:hypothetical protein
VARAVQGARFVQVVLSVANASTEPVTLTAAFSAAPTAFRNAISYVANSSRITRIVDGLRTTDAWTNPVLLTGATNTLVLVPGASATVDFEVQLVDPTQRAGTLTATVRVGAVIAYQRELSIAFARATLTNTFPDAP